MASRWPSITSTIFQSMVSGIFLPLLLVMGLIASPVSCQCGSALPHDHSLFILGTHSHDPDDRAPDRHSHRDARSAEAAGGPRNAAEVRIDGPALRVASDFASGQSRAICLVVNPSTDDAPTSEIGDTAGLPAHGCPVLPEPPPPRA
jgi:hypothetical protein